MESFSNPQHNTESQLTVEHKKLLSEFCRKNGLTVIREENLNGTLTVVIDCGYEDKKEVHVGFPDGIKNGLAATDKIKGIKMGMYGHGAWRRSILD